MRQCMPQRPESFGDHHRKRAKLVSVEKLQPLQPGARTTHARAPYSKDTSSMCDEKRSKKLSLELKHGLLSLPLRIQDNVSGGLPPMAPPCHGICTMKAIHWTISMRRSVPIECGQKFMERGSYGGLGLEIERFIFFC